MTAHHGAHGSRAVSNGPRHSLPLSVVAVCLAPLPAAIASLVAAIWFVERPVFDAWWFVAIALLVAGWNIHCTAGRSSRSWRSSSTPVARRGSCAPYGGTNGEPALVMPPR